MPSPSRLAERAPLDSTPFGAAAANARASVDEQLLRTETSTALPSTRTSASMKSVRAPSGNADRPSVPARALPEPCAPYVAARSQASTAFSSRFAIAMQKSASGSGRRSGSAKASETSAPQARARSAKCAATESKAKLSA